MSGPGARTAAIGTAVHNGWVILVTVCVADGRPLVVDRRRVELVPRGIPDQPYHHEGHRLPFPAAAGLVRRVRAAVGECARSALTAHVAHVSPTADVRAITLPQPRGVPVDLADVLAARRLIYMADRHMYELAVADAASALHLEVVHHERNGEFAYAASAMRLAEDAVRAYLHGLRATLGPPWRQDHQAAMAAALGALAPRTPCSLRAV
jgi:hypothetical protein